VCMRLAASRARWQSGARDFSGAKQSKVGLWFKQAWPEPPWHTRRRVDALVWRGDNTRGDARHEITPGMQGGGGGGSGGGGGALSTARSCVFHGHDVLVPGNMLRPDHVPWQHLAEPTATAWSPVGDRVRNASVALCPAGVSQQHGLLLRSSLAHPLALPPHPPSPPTSLVAIST